MTQAVHVAHIKGITQAEYEDPRSVYNEYLRILNNVLFARDANKSVSDLCNLLEFVNSHELTESHQRQTMAAYSPAKMHDIGRLLGVNYPDIFHQNFLAATKQVVTLVDGDSKRQYFFVNGFREGLVESLPKMFVQSDPDEVQFSRFRSLFDFVKQQPGSSFIHDVINPDFVASIYEGSQKGGCYPLDCIIRVLMADNPELAGAIPKGISPELVKVDMEWQSPEIDGVCQTHFTAVFNMNAVGVPVMAIVTPDEVVSLDRWIKNALATGGTYFVQAREAFSRVVGNSPLVANDHPLKSYVAHVQERLDAIHAGPKVYFV